MIKKMSSNNYGFLLHLIILLVAVYITVIYIILDPTTLPFMEEKMNMQQLNFNTWKIIFLSHVIIGFLALSIGPFLIMNRSKQSEKFHKNLGIIYCSTIFLNALLVPYLALYATGGILTGVAFLIIDFIWLTTIWAGVWRLAQNKRQPHREWMLRNYAATMTFVTYRILVSIISFGFEAPNNIIYPISISLAIMVNLVCVEIYIHRNRRKLILHLNTNAN